MAPTPFLPIPHRPRPREARRSSSSGQCPWEWAAGRVPETGLSLCRLQGLFSGLPTPRPAAPTGKDLDGRSLHHVSTRGFTRPVLASTEHLCRTPASRELEGSPAAARPLACPRWPSLQPPQTHVVAERLSAYLHQLPVGPIGGHQGGRGMGCTGRVQRAALPSLGQQARHDKKTTEKQQLEMLRMTALTGHHVVPDTLLSTVTQGQTQA